MMRAAFAAAGFLVAGSAGAGGGTAVTREIEPSVDHNHCTTRQFQHKTFFHEGAWFVFYSDGKKFWCQTSNDGGRTWKRAVRPVAAAPNGSSSFDVLKVKNTVYVSHVHYPLGRYDVKAPYARDPKRRGEYRSEGRVKKGRITGRGIRWLDEVKLPFVPDYSNVVMDSRGYLWIFARGGAAKKCSAYRARYKGSVRAWSAPTLCMPEEGRHALDAAALEGGKLYVVSVLTESGKLYGNFFDGKNWGEKAVLIDDKLTRVAGDDRHAAIEFDPTSKRLHLVYVDAENKLRYRFLDSPYRARDWRPALNERGRDLASGVFTCALSVDSSQEPYELVVTYGVEKYRGKDRRERLGELYARRFEGNEWKGEAVLVSQPGTIHNWYPNVNQDARDGLCVMYSRSVNPARVGVPLAVMVSVPQEAQGPSAESYKVIDTFEVNRWKSTKANCRIALGLSSKVRKGGARALRFHKAEKVIHNGMISRPVRLAGGTKGLRFWVMKGGDEAPTLGIGLRGGGTHFGFDSNDLNSTLANLPKGEWKQLKVYFDPATMSTWPRGRELDLTGIDTLVISVGDNRTRNDFGRVLYIDDMELILGR